MDTIKLITHGKNKEDKTIYAYTSYGNNYGDKTIIFKPYFEN
jgi:hypothetical protein